MKVRVKVGSSDVEAETLEVSGERISLGRNPDCEVAVDGVAFPTVSGVHARVELTADGFALMHVLELLAAPELCPVSCVFFCRPRSRVASAETSR